MFLPIISSCSNLAGCQCERKLFRHALKMREGIWMQRHAWWMRPKRTLTCMWFDLALKCFSHWLMVCYVSVIYYYYSFKIFPQFWLAKSTRIIRHKQLLMTKFGRSLCLTRKWRQKCSPLQGKAPLTEKTWGRGWVVFVVKTKMADTSLVSRVRTTAGTRRNNG